MVSDAVAHIRAEFAAAPAVVSVLLADIARAIKNGEPMFHEKDRDKWLYESLRKPFLLKLSDMPHHPETWKPKSPMSDILVGFVADRPVTVTMQSIAWKTELDVVPGGVTYAIDDRFILPLTTWQYDDVACSWTGPEDARVQGVTVYVSGDERMSLIYSRPWCTVGQEYISFNRWIQVHDARPAVGLELPDMSIGRAVSA